VQSPDYVGRALNYSLVFPVGGRQETEPYKHKGPRGKTTHQELNRKEGGNGKTRW